MDENKILQIIPAPANLLWGFDGHVSHPVEHHPYFELFCRNTGGFLCGKP